MLYLEPISLDCYAGYRAEKSPRSFTHMGIRHIVEEIADRWYEGGLQAEEPIIDYFKVLADDGKHYLLRYDSGPDQWFLVVRR
jgi:hypothetical protein